jgi:hypothetical protein
MRKLAQTWRQQADTSKKEYMAAKVEIGDLREKHSAAKAEIENWKKLYENEYEEHIKEIEESDKRKIEPMQLKK